MALMPNDIDIEGLDAIVNGLEVSTLRSYDIILVNSSGGKDSQTTLDYVVKLCDLLSIPRSRIIVVHCDLGRVEWEGTAELAREQAEHYGLRFEIVRRELGDLIDQVEQRHESNVSKGRDIAPWPSSEARWCTSDQKTAQVKKLVTALVQEWRKANGIKGRGARKVRILNCLGIRAEESVARSKKESFHADDMNWTRVDKVVDGKKVINPETGKVVKVIQPHGMREVDRWLPIFDWTEENVWDSIWASGVRYHDAYEKGMSRLSCAFCVLASKADLIIAAQHNKGLAQEYLAVEVKVGKRFTQALSIAEIIEAANRAEAEKISASA